MTLAPPFVKSYQASAVLRLTLCRPERRNALSIGMIGALTLEIEAAMSDPAVTVVVIAAEGPAFCAGHDLKELTAARSAQDRGAAFFAETFAVCEKLMLAITLGPKPVIAEVQGIATAAGCQLVAACDLAIASDTAQFATPGVNIDLFCSTPAVPLVRTVGGKHARRMLFTGDPICASEAAKIGLINEAVPAAELTATVSKLAGQIAGKTRSVLELGKTTLNQQAYLPLTEAYRAASNAMVLNILMNDAKAGIEAFITKKQANPLN
jgi:enoyl-CoA hydratase/carnithine racemase